MNINEIQKLMPAAILLLALPFFSFEKWEKPAQPPNFSELTSVLQHPLDPQKILVASPHEILERNERGNWSSLWFPRGANSIHRIIRPDAYPNRLIALTDSGAYEYVPARRSWKTLFEKHNRDQYAVLSFAILPSDPDHLFVGTHSGLFESYDGGRTWHPFSDFTHDPVYLLRCSDSHLYVGTDQRLFRSQNLTNFKEIFFLATGTGEDLASETEDPPEQDFENPQTRPALYDLILNLSAFQETLWLGTSQGVFESRDDGKSWQRLPLHGLRIPEIRHLVYSPSLHQLWAGTSRGVYRFTENKKNWEELSAGLENPNIWALTLLQGNPSKLLAVTPAGFVDWPILPDNVQLAVPSQIDAGLKQTFQNLLYREPSIHQVEHRVIHDSDTSNWKIQSWHASSRLKTLLPDVSFKKDLSRSTSIDLDRGGTSDADRYILGPENRSRGWDFGVSWNLGDLIWSSSQTSIDSREKMMIELRRDLLAEATRIYFERRRLQMEILFSPAATEQAHLENLLRLEELTALLDGMTGGWYGKQLERIYRNQPEMKKVWEFHESTAALKI